ncbi:UDP-N-acetylmuramate:L-alanyl-gamma-D-glutamyl-meso-diaminopimelate ligase [Xenorhabdus bovienii]|uniref:UDP-N-acetylmuramate--L-alanyl-gamma-D-glutamyl-meso-2,6-diaminoheptandioate ligase n=1 Tax=Xenorhabdus bovienii str. Intermedium TaxID=1379677 RepID=A0A077Q678_XENBV|nr:UDP-N-acetylmuramate:L-alanyl-gamma-D-glutamyl-meso-diaminopimelate ligase [Xenorhabdus bovienii]MDE1481965.1 UDP-N-acetylmuramate:L-alanyl-gamma-D-glutamyl-meso-diaminopimelate ligase [Xenorhabdus bovienii]MDE9428301.1 UDP-N-acetylmuramate:L-alanyl-gamma-D-glutamyl-meso-diaminopimelate ligase [Xenorhabdus bovienii]MDE9432253.1 UDP-N-acetylmuramate:L-alanyl-gamma-D-glutamyl-meso-diaminopimelate ligase [Xenorhabdus bovienii]MDE9441041.1 UDP-N-acetylmuramate:L-alanyl-gamma-D-glutamyl-meso-diam
MRIHILGICGTFMGGLAILARSLGHEVTGSDANVYPPMSTLLEKQGIELIQGYDPLQLDPEPDMVIIGNAMTRGNPCVEAVLDRGIPYTSGPQWLHDHVLPERWVLAVAGTHGKTTTAGMLAWILEACGYKPGFLIGGVPGNFDVSAQIGESPFFVIEADEYDCAFFDKRSKFVHYGPRTLIMNNLEFDHADIFENLAAVQKQFHHLVRVVPGSGKILVPDNDINLKHVLGMGCWSELEHIGETGNWQAKKVSQDSSIYQVFHQSEQVGEVNWSLVGEHNMYNGLIAIAAAHHVGVQPADACQVLGDFINARRRLELRGEVNGISVYDDFAHHPTAILATLAALRSKVGGVARILAVLEPRSNTMKMGMSKNDIAPSLGRADEVFLYQPANIPWQVAEIAEHCIQPARWSADIDALVRMIVEVAQPGDYILIMSNGGFGGIHEKLLTELGKKVHEA